MPHPLHRRRGPGCRRRRLGPLFPLRRPRPPHLQLRPPLLLPHPWLRRRLPLQRRPPPARAATSWNGPTATAACRRLSRARPPRRGSKPVCATTPCPPCLHGFPTTAAKSVLMKMCTMTMLPPPLPPPLLPPLLHRHLQLGTTWTTTLLTTLLLLVRPELLCRRCWLPLPLPQTVLGQQTATPAPLHLHRLLWPPSTRSNCKISKRPCRRHSQQPKPKRSRCCARCVFPFPVTFVLPNVSCFVIYFVCCCCLMTPALPAGP